MHVSLLQFILIIGSFLYPRIVINSGHPLITASIQYIGAYLDSVDILNCGNPTLSYSFVKIMLWSVLLITVTYLYKTTIWCPIYAPIYVKCRFYRFPMSAADAAFIESFPLVFTSPQHWQHPSFNYTEQR